MILANKDAVEHVAETVLERKEIYGDELIQLLDSVVERLGAERSGLFPGLGCPDP